MPHICQQGGATDPANARRQPGVALPGLRRGRHRRETLPAVSHHLTQTDPQAPTREDPLNSLIDFRSAAASVESVRLDPELRQARREDHETTSSMVRKALRDYLGAG